MPGRAGATPATRTEVTMESELRKTIKNTISDMVADLLYYDRKEDDALPMDAIDGAIRRGEITVDEIVAQFRDDLAKGLKK
jgi:hypothetical protein